MASEEFEAALNAFQEGDVLSKADLYDLLKISQETVDRWFEAYLQQGQQLAQARGLLERFASEEPRYFDDSGDDHTCIYCGGDDRVYSPVNHTRDCPWVQARAFLERWKKACDGE